jgi:Ser/Thr protein kinase RdoA (MazF antagonist)
MSETTIRENIKFLDSDVPDFGAEAAARAVRELYGIEGAFSRLYSERDQNFRVRAADGTEYVFKIANSDEDPGVLDMQHQALSHVEARDPNLPVPRVIRTRKGAMSGSIEDAGGKAHIVRLLSFMPGIDLAEVPMTPKVLRALGATTARLDKALRSFFHPSANHVLLWDLKRLPELRHNTGVIADLGQRRKIEAVIDHFAGHVLPLLGGLRWQVIHNDAHSSNVLVAEDDPERIAGIIDYGDMIHAPLINDVAIAAAGMSLDGIIDGIRAQQNVKVATRTLHGMGDPNDGVVLFLDRGPIGALDHL